MVKCNFAGDVTRRHAGLLSDHQELKSKERNEKRRVC